MDNLFSDIPKELPEELIQFLVNNNQIRIERILSHGHTSPKQGWYDQEQDEWVLLIQGQGTLEFEDNRQLELKPGDFINIPAHQKHKVVYTSPAEITIWLAIFYDGTTSN